MKAAKTVGLVDRYEHIFDFEAFLQAIIEQPVMVGSYWTNTMFEPDTKGLITVGQLEGSNLAGGHEYLCIGVNFDDSILCYRNSWGRHFGKHGNFYMTFDDQRRLLEAQGDSTVPIGATKAADKDTGAMPV